MSNLQSLTKGTYALTILFRPFPASYISLEMSADAKTLKRGRGFAESSSGLQRWRRSAQTSRIFLFFFSCPESEAALRAAGECADAFLIGGAEFLGVRVTIVHTLLRQLLQKCLV